MPSTATDMKNGTCPKCGAQDVRVQTRNVADRNSLPVYMRRWAQLNNYVCVSCGYLESYVDDADLQAVADNWPRVES